MYLAVCPLSMARVYFPAMANYLRDVSLTDHTLPTRLKPEWQKMAQSPLNTTHNLWTPSRKAYAQQQTGNG